MARRKKKRRRGRGRRLFRLAAGVLLPLVVLSAAVLVHVYVELTQRFEGRLWQIPSRVFSDRLVLHEATRISPGALLSRLDRSGYREVDGAPSRPGQFRWRGGLLDVHLKPFEFPDESLPARRVLIRFVGQSVVSLHDPMGGRLRRVDVEPELLAVLYGPQREERQVVALDEMPETLIHAVLAAEDARFFSHHGVDPLAVVRAALANVRSGRVTQGGSTITQQTVKNLYLGHERTWWRKLREALMASVLDWRYPKGRILEVYLNEVYLGQRGSVAVCGMGAAARFYFGRGVGELSVGESALLAGLIRSPGGYNPFLNPDRARRRRDHVLEAMARLGRLSDEQVEAARSEPLRLAHSAARPVAAPYAVDFLRAQLAELYPARTLSQEGLRMFTTVDTHLQEAADEALRAGLERLEREAPGVSRQAREKPLQGLILVTRPATGEILVMVGGRNYQQSQFNRAVQARRQPGSCFKPFVYLAGFEAAADGVGGLVAASVLQDEPLTLRSGGKAWQPENYDGRYRGPVSARRALEQSLNVPTVRAAQRVGLRRIADVAQRCGFPRGFRPLPSLALGAQEVTPLELATAYGTVANLGIRAAPRIVEAVTDSSGRTLERQRIELARAIRAESAFLATDILRGVMDRGTGRSSRALGFRGLAAGKTGTTDDTRDSWFVGFTPDLLALIWVGYDDNTPTGLTGASGALPIWVDFMKRAGLADTWRPFPEPPGILRRIVDPTSGQLAVRGCTDRGVELFSRGTEPRESCDLHRPGFFRRLRDRLRRRTL